MSTTKEDTTEYLFKWDYNSRTYVAPFKQELAKYLEERKMTKQQVIDYANSYSQKLFFGTQAEYDILDDLQYIYFNCDGKDGAAVWRWTGWLKDGRKGTVPLFKDMVLPNYPTAIEITKTEYDILKAKNDADKALADKINLLKANTSTKLAAYIIRCEEYMTQHLDKISGNAMSSFIGTNGKIDTNALKIVIENNQDKITSMSALCEVYLAWITYIEGGTQADLDKLPSDDYVKVNIVIDELWKVQHDSERKALIAKLHSSELEFAIVDKYSQVVSDEPEPEVKSIDIKQLIRRKKHK